MRDDFLQRTGRRQAASRLLTITAVWLAFAFIALPRPVNGTEVSRPLELVFVLDSSASMKQNDPGRRVLSAAGSLVERLGPDDGAGLVVFGGSATAPVELAPVAGASHRSALLKAIGGVRYEEVLSDFSAGVERALYELRTHGRPGARLAIVFFSDGLLDTGSPATNAERTAWLTTDLINEAKRREIRIFAIAFSERADYLLIRQMAVSTGGEYYRATNSDDVEEVFETLASHLVEPDSSAAITPALDAGPVATAEPSVSGTFMPRVLLVLVGLLGLAGLAVLVIAYRRTRLAQTATTASTTGDLEVGNACDSDYPVAPAALVAIKTDERIPITRTTLSVGRDERNDVILQSELVSLDHARIEVRDRQYYVVDLKSTNGTFVNGRRIDSPTALDDGDIVDFDEFRYQFVGGATGLNGTVVRTSPVERTIVRLEPIRNSAVPDPGLARRHRELIETHAGTHQLVFCAVHAEQCAIAHCVRCGKAGCAVCVSIDDEGPICTTCADALLPRTLG